MFIMRRFSNLMTGLLIYSILTSFIIVFYLLSPTYVKLNVASVDQSESFLQFERETDNGGVSFHQSAVIDQVVMFDQHDHIFNPENKVNICEIFNHLKSIDVTVGNLNTNLFCDEYAHSSDLACRQFFYQAEIPEKGTCTRNSEDNMVPKIVYYVIFGVYTFKFWEYVSVVSAKKFINPTAIYIIADAHPLGYWWKRVLTDVTGVRFIYRERPKIGNSTVKWKHHLSDLVRLQMLLANGGIYLDTDMIVVRSLDPLRNNDITMGLIENGTGMGNALIMARRGSPFVREWYENYRNYNNDEFYKNSLHVPRDMWLKNPKSIHLESDKFYRPNWFEADLLFKRTDYPWRDNYAIHVWTNGNPVPKGPDVLRELNTTIAQVFRHVLYDEPGVKGHS